MTATCSLHPSSLQVTRLQGKPSRQSVVVRAADGFCRDKIATPVSIKEGAEGISKVAFLGAGGQQVEIDAPKASKPTAFV